MLLRNPVTGVRQFARVTVPTILSRFVPLGGGRFVPLEDVIAQHLHQLFSGMQIIEHSTFRVTRNEDVEVEEGDLHRRLGAGDRASCRCTPSHGARLPLRAASRS